MFKHIVVLLLVAISLIFSVSYHAISFEFIQNDSCVTPSKPYGGFSDQYQVDSYNNDVARFKQCIKAFIEDQKDDIQKHSDVVDNAIEKWNNFVRYQQ